MSCANVIPPRPFLLRSRHSHGCISKEIGLTTCPSKPAARVAAMSIGEEVTAIVRIRWKGGVRPYQAPYGGLRSLPWFGSARSMPQPFAGSPSGNGNANKFATASRPVVVMSPQRPSTSGFVSTTAWGFGARNHSRCRAERLAEALAVLVSELLS
jgi:hypothetical protein